MPNSDPGAPAIIILSPVGYPPIRNPFDVEIDWKTGSGDATVDPTSFRVHSGPWDMVDITGDILKYAKPTPSGISARGVTLAPGDYHILIKIADTMGRTRREEHKFSVVP